MFNEKPYQSSLFDDCSKDCEAYTECGGFRSTAPCGCVWTASSGLRYQCHKCYLICRDRGRHNPSSELEAKEFLSNVEDGLSFDQVAISQGEYQFPIYIPTNTDKFKGNDRFSVFVAVDARMLFNYPYKKPATLKPQFQSENEIRSFLKVDTACALIAVFNGEDKKLEKIWAMPRKKMFLQLKSVGFTICTGPTFSINALTVSGVQTPFSHHVCMLMRHNRMLSEIYDAGMIPVPNIYWLDNDARQLNKWCEWLKRNNTVKIISRDFTSTRKWSSMEPKVNELIRLLNEVGRSFHILIIGSGNANAPRVVERLSQAGHTISVVTSAPFLKAMHGSKYFVSADGKLTDGPSEKTESFDALIKHNIEVFEKKLTASVVYQFAQ